MNGHFSFVFSFQIYPTTAPSSLEASPGTISGIRLRSTAHLTDPSQLPNSNGTSMASKRTQPSLNTTQ